VARVPVGWAGRSQPQPTEAGATESSNYGLACPKIQPRTTRDGLVTHMEAETLSAFLIIPIC
jgi:hypothetical protein